MAIRVLLVDDHAIIRDAVRGLLERERDVQVVGEADNGHDAVRLARELRPDVVLMDVTIPVLNGIDATRQIVAEGPNVRVVVLSMHASRPFVAEALKAGACCYVLKDAGLDEVGRAVRAAASGRGYFSEGAAEVVLNDYVRTLQRGDEGPGVGGHKPLSPRERQVLQLIGEDHMTKEIAAILHLSTKTVETHRRKIMEKTGIYTLTGLIKYAIREGLASLDG